MILPLSFKLQYHYYLIEAFFEKFVIFGTLKKKCLKGGWRERIFWVGFDVKSITQHMIKMDSPPSIVGVVGDLFVDVVFVDFVLVLMFWFCIKSNVYYVYTLCFSHIANVWGDYSFEWKEYLNRSSSIYSNKKMEARTLKIVGLFYLENKYWIPIEYNNHKDSKGILILFCLTVNILSWLNSIVTKKNSFIYLEND